MIVQEFERFEFKYFVPEERVEPMRAFMAPYLERDTFAGEGGAYLTTNLYFDSPDLELYWAHVRSEIDRFKLRVRYYGDGPELFFEIKRKVRDVIVKKRSRVKRELWDAVWAGDRAAIERSSNPAHLQTFLDLALIYRAEPVYFIRYEREAYENVFGEEARVTFDRRLSYQPARGHELRPEDGAWCFIDSSLAFRGLEVGTLLEMKFDACYPTWMAELARKFDLVRIQFSKYLNTVDSDRQRQTWALEGSPQSRVLQRPWALL